MPGQQSAGALPAAAAFVPSNSDGQKYRRLTYRTEPHCLALGRWALFCFSLLFAGLFLLLLLLLLLILFCVMLAMMIAILKSAPKTHYVHMRVLLLQSRRWPFLYAASVGWGCVGSEEADATSSPGSELSGTVRAGQQSSMILGWGAAACLKCMPWKPVVKLTVYIGWVVSGCVESQQDLAYQELNITRKTVGKTYTILFLMCQNALTNLKADTFWYA